MMLPKYAPLLLTLCLAVLMTRSLAAGDSLTAKQIKVLGDSCYEKRKFTEALQLFTQSMAVAEQTKDFSCYAECLGCTGNIYAVFKDYERANHYFKMGYERAMADGKLRYASLFCAETVLTYCLTGHPKEARTYYRLLDNIPRTDKHEQDEYYHWFLLAKIAEAEGRTDKAIQLMQVTMNYVTDTMLPAGFETNIYAELTDIYLNRGEKERALNCAREVKRLSKACGDPYFIVSSYELLAKVYRSMGVKDSMAKYMDLYVSLSDSVFPQTNFYKATNNLLNFESHQAESRMEGLQRIVRSQTFAMAAAGLVILLLIAAWTAVWVANRRLRATRRLLIEKNRRLIEATEREGRRAGGPAEELSAQEIPPKNDGELADGTAGWDCTDNGLLGKIEDVMGRVDVISRQDFTLDVLAEMTGSNTTYVSAVINRHFCKGFKSLLNERRINEACKRLADNELYGRFTIQAISEGVGYNAQSNFIKVFKQQMGMTPSTFRRMATE
ncbi:MAG: helix-turn-helix domain-containing protein [Alloprevotella sp.]